MLENIPLWLDGLFSGLTGELAHTQPRKVPSVQPSESVALPLVFFYFILALSLSVQVTSVCPCPSLMPFLGVHAIRQEGPCRLLTGYCFYPWLILRCLIIYMSYSSKDFNKRFSSHTLGLNSRPCCLDKPMIFQIIRCCFPLL